MTYAMLQHLTAHFGTCFRKAGLQHLITSQARQSVHPKMLHTYRDPLEDQLALSRNSAVRS